MSKPSKPFLWTPGDGPNFDAGMRLLKHFRRPHDSMGEAWFMGETRKTFDLNGDLLDLPRENLLRALDDIAGGLACFGPRREWSDWFHYMLADLSGFGHFEGDYGTRLMEPLISAFITHYPEGIVAEPYKGFRADALATLGRAIMHESCWQDGRIVIGSILHDSASGPSGYWGWYKASGDLASSLFFCLKYLEDDDVEPWLRSVFAIACPHWRAQLIVWCVGAHPLLSGEVSQISGLRERQPEIRWEGSNWLKGNYTGRFDNPAAPPPFMPKARCDTALRTISSLLNEDTFLDWLISISAFDYLEAELIDLPDRFQSLYMGHP